jgi:hypothetical protein
MNKVAGFFKGIGSDLKELELLLRKAIGKPSYLF